MADRPLGLDLALVACDNPVRCCQPNALNGKLCWLAHLPTLSPIESATFQAVLRSGPSGMTRRFEFGKADQYFCVIGHGVGDASAIALFSSQERARQEYDDAIKRHDQDRHLNESPPLFAVL